jgi:hypothetical protein
LTATGHGSSRGLPLPSGYLSCIDLTRAVWVERCWASADVDGPSQDDSAAVRAVILSSGSEQAEEHHSRRKLTATGHGSSRGLPLPSGYLSCIRERCVSVTSRRTIPGRQRGCEGRHSVQRQRAGRGVGSLVRRTPWSPCARSKSGLGASSVEPSDLSLTVLFGPGLEESVGESISLGDVDPTRLRKSQLVNREKAVPTMRVRRGIPLKHVPVESDTQKWQFSFPTVLGKCGTPQFHSRYSLKGLKRG